MRVLYIEDNPSSIHVMRKIAGHVGCDLTVAETLAAGRTALADGPYDILLLDINLPDGDGLVLAKQMRSLLPAMPIVAVTANAMPGDRERCLEAGCIEYVSKPFTFAQMVALIRRY